MNRTSSALVIARYKTSHLDWVKEIAAEYRDKGFRTRLVYRGPRPMVRSWRTGSMMTPGYTLKKDAVSVDLYVYKK